LQTKNKTEEFNYKTMPKHKDNYLCSYNQN